MIGRQNSKKELSEQPESRLQKGKRDLQRGPSPKPGVVRAES